MDFYVTIGLVLLWFWTLKNLLQMINVPGMFLEREKGNVLFR